ncbi:MAG: hypothetical protein OHK0046_47840 [Anaerolineae bacterium]
MAEETWNIGDVCKPAPGVDWLHQDTLYRVVGVNPNFTHSLLITGENGDDWHVHPMVVEKIAHPDAVEALAAALIRWIDASEYYVDVFRNNDFEHILMGAHDEALWEEVQAETWVTAHDQFEDLWTDAVQAVWEHYQRDNDASAD